jgi:hypothetical protein
MAVALLENSASTNEERWESLVAEAHAAFLLTCSLRLSEPSSHSINEDFMSVSLLLFFYFLALNSCPAAISHCSR